MTRNYPHQYRLMLVDTNLHRRASSLVRCDREEERKGDGEISYHTQTKKRRRKKKRTRGGYEDVLIREQQYTDESYATPSQTTSTVTTSPVPITRQAGVSIVLVAVVVRVYILKTGKRRERAELTEE